MKNAPKWKVVMVWVLTVILALLMALVGSAKFTQPDSWTQMATRIDLPYWLFQVAGVMELVGALMLVIPKVAAVGGSTLAVVMFGAAFAHVWAGEPSAAIAPLVYASIALFIARQRMDQLPWRNGRTQMPVS